MKRLIFLFFVLVIGGVWIYVQATSKSSVPSDIHPETYESNPPQEEEDLLFVPYWTLSDEMEISDADTLIYFGITIEDDGIDYSDEGYKNIQKFVSLSGDQKKILTLRIFNQGGDSKILNNKLFQEKIAQEVGRVAKDYGFNGVALDFETSALGFASTEEKITLFYQEFAHELNGSGLELSAVVFGDTYYRGRPYNMKKISEVVDRVIIMAYDFHKARLNPGPNFPFSNKKTYGYDFQTMVNDFKEDIAHEKISVALGYFGYDWELDSTGINTGIAEPLSFNKAKEQFINKCLFASCKIEKNPEDGVKVRYKDEDGDQHEVWFEDKDSIEKKINFLKEKGINQIAIWAYSFY